MKQLVIKKYKHFEEQVNVQLQIKDLQDEKTHIKMLQWTPSNYTVQSF